MQLGKNIDAQLDYTCFVLLGPVIAVWLVAMNNAALQQPRSWAGSGCIRAGSDSQGPLMVLQKAKAG